MKVGFKLENGFKSDTGALKTEDRLFDREASVSLYGDFGTLSMGRMGGVASSAGTYDIVYSMADAFDGGDNNILGLAISGRSDNMITYQTPKFAGLQGTFQYSFNQSGAEKDQSSNNISSSLRLSRVNSAISTWSVPMNIRIATRMTASMFVRMLRRFTLAATTIAVSPRPS